MAAHEMDDAQRSRHCVHRPVMATRRRMCSVSVIPRLLETQPSTTDRVRDITGES
jgi:hypothetical protein